MNTDLESFFRNKVESMLMTASWVEPVQRRLNLKAVSQVWGDKPEWYIWLDHAPGVYALVLEDTSTVEVADMRLLTGHFAIKCYPYADDSIFTAFSSQEQEMAASELFDETHTPRLEAKEGIPETFFTVGSVSMMMDDAETMALFSVDSLDVLRMWSQGASENPIRSVANAGDEFITRNVAGWQISYPLFDRFISLYAFYARQPPVFIGATCSPGFEYLLDAGQNLTCRSSAASQQLAASLLFHKTSRAKHLVDTLWQAALRPEERIILMCDLPAELHNGRDLSGPPEVPINSLWWELANTELKSELASTCGCCDHAHSWS